MTVEPGKTKSNWRRRIAPAAAILFIGFGANWYFQRVPRDVTVYVDTSKNCAGAKKIELLARAGEQALYRGERHYLQAVASSPETFTARIQPGAITFVIRCGGMAGREQPASLVERSYRIEITGDERLTFYP